MSELPRKTAPKGIIDPAAALLGAQLRPAAGACVTIVNAGTSIPVILAAPAAAAAPAAVATITTIDRSIVAQHTAQQALDAIKLADATSLLAAGADAGIETQDIIAIRIPREKLPLLQILHDAFRSLKVGGICYAAGATNEGIKSASRYMQELFGNAETIARDSGHHLVVANKRQSAPTDASSFTNPFLDPAVFNQISCTLRGHDIDLFTRPGVFSWDHLDEATSILASVMEINGDVLDLGCGAGALGVIAAKEGAHRVIMLDADVDAVRCANETARRNNVQNAEAIVSDVTSALSGGQFSDSQRFDVVITNPPFHSGKTTDLALPNRFISEAYAALKKGGQLYLVANRTLPYEREIQRVFGNVGTAHDGPRFKVLTAGKQ